MSSSSNARPRIQGRALHHPVSEPPPANRGDLWGLAGFVKHRLPSGVVTATFVFQGSSQWCEEGGVGGEKHGRVGECEILCLPSEQSSSPPLVLAKLLLSLYLPGFTAANEKAAAAKTRTASSAADLWRAVTGESKANKPARRGVSQQMMLSCLERRRSPSP